MNESGTSNEVPSSLDETATSNEVPSIQTGGVINHSDFEDDEDDYGESETSKIVNSNLDRFIDKIENLSVEGLTETLRTINFMEEEYSKGISASAESQLQDLNLKKSLAEQELAKKVIEEEAIKKEATSKG